MRRFLVLLIILGQASMGLCKEEKKMEVIDYQIPTGLGGKRVELDLRGVWQFLPSQLENNTLPGEDAKWQELRVPSWWEKENPAWSTTIDAGWYRKVIKLSGNWKDKQMVIHFDRVNYQCWIYVNRQLAGDHFGGFTAFEIDLTEKLKIGENELLVRVVNWTAAVKSVDPEHRFRASEYRRVNNTPKEEKEKWPKEEQERLSKTYEDWRSRLVGPIAWCIYISQPGICDGVKLIARSRVYIDDVYIKTSFREKRIDLEITIKNNTKKKHKLKLTSKVKDSEICFNQEIELNPDSSEVVKLSRVWDDAKLWWPYSPYLYELETSLFDDSQLIDMRKDKFGFREFWIEGNEFRLNGIKIKLFGDSCHWNVYGYSSVGTEDPPEVSPKIKDSDYRPTDEKIKETIYHFKRRNLNCMRCECQLFDIRQIEIADEMGMLMMDSNFQAMFPGIGEHGTDEYGGKESTYWKVFWKNLGLQIRDWVRQRRNHPSIIIWAMSNESLCWIADKRAVDPNEPSILGAEELKKCVKEIDPTRPVIFYGDSDVAGKAEIISFHYPGCGDSLANCPDGYYYMVRCIESGGIDNYRGWGKINVLSKPLCITEFHFLDGFINMAPFLSQEQNIWGKYKNRLPTGQATCGALTRMAIEGYRCADIAGIFPYGIHGYKPIYEYQKIAFSPQAVFVREYNKNFFSQEQVKRTVSIYNDTLKDTQLKFNWQLNIENNSYSSGTISVQLKHGGSHREEVILNMPEVRERNKLEWVIELFNGERLVFKDKKYYSVFPRDLKAQVGSKLDEIRRLQICLFDTQGDTEKVIRSIGLPLTKLAEEEELELDGFDFLIIGENSLADFISRCSGKVVRDYLQRGGRILCLQHAPVPKKRWSPRTLSIDINDWFDKKITIEWNSFYWGDGMNLPVDWKHPVWNKLAIEFMDDPVENSLRGDLTFWGKNHRVSRGSLSRITEPGFKVISQAGWHTNARASMLEVEEDEGRCIFCQLDVIKKFDEEPVARQILINLIEYLGK